MRNKNLRFLLSVMLMVLTYSTAFAERKAHGFLLSSKSEQSSGIYSFDADKPEAGTKLLTNPAANSSLKGKPQAAAYSQDNTYYIFGGLATGAGYGLHENKLGSDEIKLSGRGSISGLTVYDMTYDNSSQMLYAVGESEGGYYLYQYIPDYSTFAPINARPFPVQVSALACNKDGQLYALTANGDLNTVNMRFGTLTKIGNLGTSFDPTNTDIEFDPDNGALFWSYTTDGGTKGYLATIDINSLTVTSKEFKEDASVIGLCLPVGSQEPEVPLPARKAFGFLLNSTNDSNVSGVYSFDANKPEDGITLLVSPAATSSLYGKPQAAAYLQDSTYYIFGKLGTTGYYGMHKNKLGSDQILPVGRSRISGITIYDMTYDASNETLYAVGKSGSDYHLYQFDYFTGGLSPVGPSPLTAQLSSLACDNNGQLFALAADGKLNKIDKETGALTEIGTLSISFDPTNSDMEFDPDSGLLYWSYTTDEGTKGHLATIDENTLNITSKEFKENASVIGLCLPKEPQKPVDPSSNRNTFGYVVGGTNPGVYSFDANKPGDGTTFIVKPTALTLSKDPLAAAYAQDSSYYLAGEFQSNGYAIYRNKLTTGTLDAMIAEKNTIKGILIKEMTYDNSSNSLYVIGTADSNYNLYKFSFSTTNLVAINTSPLTAEIIGLACTKDGQLYALSTEGNLCKVDKTSGLLTILGKLDVTFNPTNTDIEFDPDNNTLYWSYTSGKAKGYLSTIDINTLEVTPQQFKNNENVIGICLPMKKETPARLGYAFTFKGSSAEFSSFDAEKPNNGVVKVADYPRFRTPNAGVFANDNYYFIGMSEDQTKTILQKTDLTFGQIEEIGTDNKITGVTFNDLTYDYTTRTMFGIGTTSDASNLYKFDLTTGAYTVVAKLASLTATEKAPKYVGLACSLDGQLYGITGESYLNKINKTTGAINTIAKTNIEIGYFFKADLEFDHSSNKLYFSYVTPQDAEGLSNTYLATINMTTAEASTTLLPRNISEITGLAFPGGFDIPEVVKRLSYGMLLSSPSYFCFFDAGNADKGITKINDYSQGGKPNAGAYANGYYYVIGRASIGTALQKTDLDAKNLEVIGNAINGVTFKDMSYDKTTETMYAIGTTSGKTNLYTINLTSGVYDKVAELDASYLTLACSAEGQFYTLSNQGDFVKLDKNTGKVTSIGKINEAFGKSFAMCMEFDRLDGTLYWSYCNENMKGYLATLNPETAVATPTEIKPDGDMNSQVIGLCFPTDEEKPNAKKWYAYSLFSYSNPSNHGLVSLDPSDLATVVPVGTFDNTLLSSGAYAYDKYYGIQYEPTMENASQVNLLTIDLATGTTKKVCDLTNKIPMMWDLTFDRSTGTMYGISMQNGYSELYTVNLTTGEGSRIAVLENDYRGLACTSDGILYAIAVNGDLHKLNKLTGTYELIGSTGIALNATTLSSLSFEYSTGKLYYTYTTTDYDSYLSEISTTSGNVVNASQMPDKDQLIGLYIPYEMSALAPAAVSVLSVTADNGELKTVLEWTNPSTQVNGGTLTAITKVEIIRDGNVVNTLTGQMPGQKGNWTDDAPVHGYNNYAVKVYNDQGGSELRTGFLYVGKDVPGKPLNVILTVDKTKVKVRWEAPAAGLNLGWYDQSTTRYDVVRLPDEVTVASNQTSVAYEEEVGTMRVYSYKIITHNTEGTGGSAVSNQVIVGAALPIPYICDFTDEAECELWTLDNWTIGALGLDGGIHGMKHIYDGSERTDDWAYSPLLNMEQGKTYQLTFSARAVSPGASESMKITAGTDKTKEKQTIAILDIPAVKESSTTLTNYEATFTVPANGSYSVAFNCYAHKNELQVSHVKVGYLSGITTHALDGVKVYTKDGKICLEGAYSSVQVYNQLGSAMYLSENAVAFIDIQWAAGVYFVKVQNETETGTYKVVIQ